jgi:glycosyltransferase involved in cell wall biosynthesis
VGLTFPSVLFRAVCGLPGLVEYSAIDVEHFRRDSPWRDGKGLSIGRHGRAYPLKFHANDPAFFRALMARGHRVRVLGGSIIAAAFAHDRLPSPQLLDVGSVDVHAFLQSLDVFVYRKHPRIFETCGTVILEAMAMELPVIAFADDCGGVELIEHRENGFLVRSEVEALACVDALHADPALRQRMGRAARATIVALMRQQESIVVDYYVGANPTGAQAAA